jgi:DNA-binding winged helix-turn-helix (wHTH) protein
MISMTWPQYKRGECVVSGFTVRLSPMETEVLLCLLLRHPAPSSADQLIEFVYPDPDNEPEDARGAVYQYVYKIKDKIGAYRITREDKLGWRILHKPEVRCRYRPSRAKAT